MDGYSSVRLRQVGQAVAIKAAHDQSVRHRRAPHGPADLQIGPLQRGIRNQRAPATMSRQETVTAELQAEDRKYEEDLVEKVPEDEKVAPVALVSNHAALGRGPTVRKFWRLFITGVLVASAGMYA